jgi:serine/threonine protein kinase/tetratricopeptide (TPR) repeat protein
MHCKHCGISTASTASHCPSCGRRVEQGPPDVAAAVLTPPPVVDGETSLGFPREDDSAQTSFDFHKAVDPAETIHTTPPSAPQAETRFAAPGEIPPAPGDDAAETLRPPTARDPEETSFEPVTQPPRSSSGLGRPGTGSGVKRPLTGGRRPASGSTGPLDIGQAFGERYHIIKVLGVGGMGAVYQAWDAELGVSVALKVIRPEIAADPFAALDIERRFKRELLLARQVTHKNVVRIHDLGEIDGIKYITMSYIDGSDLASVLKKETKLPVPRALKIARGMASGLVCAHVAGVVHRDLKPANIMLGADDEPTIMDFGIARSSSRGGQEVAPPVNLTVGDLGSSAALLAGRTMAGAIIGTVEYMAPEQAKGQEVDQRADIYAFGLILYDMLVGRKRSERAASAIEELQGRMAQAPPAPRTVNPEIPPAVDAIINRCLEPDAAKRFQTTEELEAALARLDDNGKPLPIIRRLTKKGMAAAAVLVVSLLTATFYLAQWLFAPPVQHDPVVLIISDFQNNTNDPTFNQTLEPMVRRGLEDAGFISAYDRARIRSTFGVQPPEALDEAAARDLAIKQGVGVVLAGAISPRGNGYDISLKAMETVTGNTIVTSDGQASNKDQVLEVATRLVTTIRRALGDETSDSAQLFAMKSLSTASLDVVTHYAAAVEAQSRGKYEDALRSYQSTVQLDPNFGLGYQGMAAMSRNLGRLQDAEKYSNEALRHLDGMTTRERFAVRGLYFLSTGDLEQCVSEYAELIKQYPVDAIAHNSRANCLSRLRRMTEAVDEVRQAIQILSKPVLFRGNLAVYSAYAGDFPGAEQAAQALEQPTDMSTIALAFAQLGQGQLPNAAATYQQLAGLSARGRSWSASGLGDLALYEGRFSDAARIFEEGAAADLEAKNADRAARKLTSLASVQLLRGQKSAALTAVEKALEISKAAPIRFLAGRVYVEANELARARALAEGLAAELPAEPHALGKIIEGEIALKSGKMREAVDLLTDANDEVDTWLGHFILGRAYLEGGSLPRADSEFDLCIKRRGEALSFLVDEEPTYGHFPIVHYYLGRVREGLKTSGYVESYREYLRIRGASKEDPLLADVRRRAGS